MSEGLNRASLLPVGTGHLEAQAGFSSTFGGYLRGEALYRFTPRLSGFGFVEWRPAETMAGAGVRLTF